MEWALMLGLMGAPAQGGGDRVTLRWAAPSRCPDAEVVQARIAQYLADADPSDAAVVATGAVHEAGDGTLTLSLRLEVDGEVDERELTDGDCAGLAEVAALWVAIAVSPTIGDVPAHAEPTTPAVDDEGIEAPSEPTGVVPPVVVEPPMPALPTSPTAEPQPMIGSAPSAERGPEPRRRPAGSVRARAGVGVGHLPFGATASTSLGLSWPLFRVELLGHYDIPRRVQLLVAPDRGGRVGGWGVGGRACGVVPLVSWLSLPLCGGIEAGQVLGYPSRLLNPQRRGPAWVGASAVTALRAQVASRVALWIEPELVVPLTRPTLTVGGSPEPLFRAAGIGFRGFGGVEIMMW